MEKKDFMQRAIDLSINSVKNGGGPFGAVIVKDGEIIAEASNSVTIDNDPTAHAEVNAIRKATKKLGSFDLTGCDIYTSCEPCPMCLGAIYWAHLDKIYYANDRKDAAKIGFDDDFIYQEIALKPVDRHKPMEIFMRAEAIKAFEAWMQKTDKTDIPSFFMIGVYCPPNRSKNVMISSQVLNSLLPKAIAVPMKFSSGVVSMK